MIHVEIQILEMQFYMPLLLCLLVKSESIGFLFVVSVCFGFRSPLSPLFCLITVQYNPNVSNTDDSFTVDDSNYFFSPYKILPIAQENKRLGIIFLFYHGIVCCVYSLESPHRGDSNEYTQHTTIV